MWDATMISMGIEVTEHDNYAQHQVPCCDQVIVLFDYRFQLFDYLQSRMTAITPNLIVLVGKQCLVFFVGNVWSN